MNSYVFTITTVTLFPFKYTIFLFFILISTIIFLSIKFFCSTIHPLSRTLMNRHDFLLKPSSFSMCAFGITIISVLKQQGSHSIILIGN